jgi:hypothetical protein
MAVVEAGLGGATRLLVDAALREFTYQSAGTVSNVAVEVLQHGLDYISDIIARSPPSVRAVQIARLLVSGVLPRGSSTGWIKQLLNVVPSLRGQALIELPWSRLERSYPRLCFDLAEALADGSLQNAEALVSTGVPTVLLVACGAFPSTLKTAIANRWAETFHAVAAATRMPLERHLLQREAERLHTTQGRRHRR